MKKSGKRLREAVTDGRPYIKIDTERRRAKRRKNCYRVWMTTITEMYVRTQEYKHVRVA